MEFRNITYGTADYQDTLILRDKVMRQPLGISIYDEDFTKEEKSTIIGAYEENKMIGVGILTPAADHYNVDFLCVATSRQTQGLGKTLLGKLEKIAQEKGGELVTLEARLTALGFYEKLGYEKVSEVYLLKVAPVELVRMEKKIACRATA